MPVASDSLTAVLLFCLQAALNGKASKKGRPVAAYAVALAAALSVESPFMHIDTITVR